VRGSRGRHIAWVTRYVHLLHGGTIGNGLTTCYWHVITSASQPRCGPAFNVEIRGQIREPPQSLRLARSREKGASFPGRHKCGRQSRLARNGDPPCGGSLAPGAFCNFTVYFTPSIVGSESATHLVYDNSPGNPQSLSLSGTGQ
jgi:hypothetical protein